jgi:hypothetical protein
MKAPVSSPSIASERYVEPLKEAPLPVRQLADH